MRLWRWILLRLRNEVSGVGSRRWWLCLIRYWFLSIRDGWRKEREGYVSKYTLKRAVDDAEYHERRLMAGRWRTPFPTPLIERINRKSGRPSEPKALTTPVKGRFG